MAEKAATPESKSDKKYTISKYIRDLGSRKFVYKGRTFQADKLSEKDLAFLAEAPKFRHVSKK